jgi:glycosyltransferase involved in cell wall biosynthesis
VPVRPGDVPDISVVIPAYRGAATIAECLESVERATSGRLRQIIVVESSGDGTATIVRERFPEVTLIESRHRLTAGAARNLGLAEARGRLIFFTDQDCVVPLYWVTQLERHFDDLSVGAAGGSVGVRNVHNLRGWGVYFLEFLNHFPKSRAARRDENFLVGCNSVYRIDTLKVLRFPDRTLGEDVIFSHDLTALGFGVVYDPAVDVLHYNREGWHEFFRYNRKMGESAAIYHGVLRRWWIRPFFWAPALAFLAPAAILPLIAFDLARSRPSYFARFVLLSPMCFLGNLVWAAAFRRQLLAIRRARRREMAGQPPAGGS